MTMIDSGDFSPILDWINDDSNEEEEEENNEEEEENNEEDEENNEEEENDEEEDETPNSQQVLDDWTNVQAIRASMYENNLDTFSTYCPDEKVTKVFIGHDCDSDLNVSFKVGQDVWESPNKMINTEHSDETDYDCSHDDNDGEPIYVCTFYMYGHSKLGLCFENPDEDENWQPIEITGFEFFPTSGE